MLTYETAKRLGKLEQSYEELCTTNDRREDAIARGALSCNMGHYRGRQAYLARILPALKALADDGDEEALKAALDAENIK